MKILIFGGDSFTAKHFTWRDKYDCKFVSRSNFSERMDSASAVNEFSQIIGNVQPDVIINLISISATNIEDPLEYISSNYQILSNILNSCHLSKVKIRKFIQASSAHVYGSYEGTSISENTPPIPASLYGKSKLMSELLTNFYSDKFQIIITRPFNYTGVGQDEINFFIPKLVRAVRNKERFLVLGDLEAIRDFSDVRDISRYYERLINLENFNGTVNLCSGSGQRLSDIVEIVQQVSGHRIEIRNLTKSSKKNPIKNIKIGCNRKLQDLTGLEPIYSINDTIKWMLDTRKNKE